MPQTLRTRRVTVFLFTALLLLIALSHSARANVIINNASFEAGTLTGWTALGSVGVVGSFLTAPSKDAHQALVDKSTGVPTVATMVPFLGVTQTQLASVIGDGDPSDLSDVSSQSISSAIKQTFTVPSASSLTFDYNPYTLLNPNANQLGIYPETIVAVLDGTAYFVNDTDHINFTHNNGFLQWSDYSTFTGLPNLAAGSHTIAVAAVGSINDSGFELDNFVISGPVTVPTPDALWASLFLLPLAYLSRRRLIRR